jgi:myo-inositol-1(or 4)-monophosphatase
MLLVREAGGYLTDLKGGQTMLESGSILATNNLLHAPLQALLTNAA